MTEKFTVRQMKISQENIETMNKIKKASGRTQQWIVNSALEYFFEHEMDRLMQ